MIWIGSRSRSPEPKPGGRGEKAQAQGTVFQNLENGRRGSVELLVACLAFQSTTSALATTPLHPSTHSSIHIPGLPLHLMHLSMPVPSTLPLCPTRADVCSPDTSTRAPLLLHGCQVPRLLHHHDRILTRPNCRHLWRMQHCAMSAHGRQSEIDGGL